jgi:hypothetical protein
MKKPKSVDELIYRHHGRQCYIAKYYEHWPNKCLIFYKSDGKQMIANRESLLIESDWLKQKNQQKKNP